MKAALNPATHSVTNPMQQLRESHNCTRLGQLAHMGGSIEIYRQCYLAVKLTGSYLS